MVDESIESLLASLADDPEHQKAVEEALAGFAADMETLDGALFTALIHCLRVIGIEGSLARLLAELPYLHGLNDEPIDYQQYGLDLPDDVAEAIQQRLGEGMRPMAIDALDLHAQLPDAWQRDPYWTRLCDVFRLYNAIVYAIGGLSHVACANLWEQIDSSLGGNWASTYLARILQPLVSEPQINTSDTSGASEASDSSDRVREEMHAALGHAFVGYPLADVETEIARIARDRESHAEWAASRPPSLEVLDGGAQAPAAQASLDASDSALLRLIDRDTPARDAPARDTHSTTPANDIERADTARPEREDAPQISAAPSVDHVDARAESNGASTATRLRRYQWAIGTLCAVAVASLAVAGMTVARTETQAQRTATRAECAEARAAQVERVRAMFEAPVVIEIHDLKTGEEMETWVIPSGAQNSSGG